VSTLTSRRPSASLFDDAALRNRAPAHSKRPDGARCPPSDGGRLTLGHMVQSVWEGLLATGAADCPVCGARMEVAECAGRCGGCGASVS